MMPTIGNDATEERRTPPAAEKSKAPRTRVRGSGKVNQRMDLLGGMYLKNAPGQDIRWVYHPTHKPELSNVINRQAEGYSLVYLKDLGEDNKASLLGMDQEKPVTIGDVVLMTIAADIRQGYKDELAERAANERTRVDEEFRQAMDEVSAKGASGEHRARPHGSSVIEERERDVDVPDSHKAD